MTSGKSWEVLAPCHFPALEFQILCTSQTILRAVKGTRHKIIWNREVKMKSRCILKASSSLLDRKTPSHRIWVKILDTVELVYQLDLKLATHFGLKRTSLPVSFYCSKSHEPIRSLLETSINFTAVNHCLRILGRTPRHHLVKEVLWQQLNLYKTVGGHRLNH